MDGSSSTEWASSSPPVMTLSLAHVYDLAEEIGKEMEKLVNVHGAEPVRALMPKVIQVLEHLENCALDKASENTKIDELETTIAYYERGEAKKNEDKIRQTRELEQIEEHYVQESRDLLLTIKRLQDENRKLQSSLTAATERDSAFSEDGSYFDVDYVNRLQSDVDQQRNLIKHSESANTELKTDNEQLNYKNEKQSNVIKDLRRKYRILQNQMRSLIDERTELMAQVSDQKRDLQILHHALDSATQECQDLCQANDMCGKLVFREDDPNRPRFSLPELRDILQERNTLKASLSDLEDELALYRPRKSDGLSLRQLNLSSVSDDPVCDCNYHAGISEVDECFEAILHLNEDEEAKEKEEEEEEDFGDLPVQGPLPQDPIDAPWRKKESGIKKLFAFITSRMSTVSQNIVSSSECTNRSASEASIIAM